MKAHGIPAPTTTSPLFSDAALATQTDSAIRGFLVTKGVKFGCPPTPDQIRHAAAVYERVSLGLLCLVDMYPNGMAGEDLAALTLGGLPLPRPSRGPALVPPPKAHPEAVQVPAVPPPVDASPPTSEPHGATKDRVKKASKAAGGARANVGKAKRPKFRGAPGTAGKKVTKRKISARKANGAGPKAKGTLAV